MILRVRYADGATEDHEFYNGVHFADYIRRIDVPGSKFAFELRGQQLRYLSIQPRRDAPIESIQSSHPTNERINKSIPPSNSPSIHPPVNQSIKP